MRFAALVVAVLLGACGARGSGEPAWPKAAERETDGGESIAPRESIKAVAEAEPEDTAAATTPAAADATPGAEAATPTATPTSAPTVTAPEDTILIEEIVIEISDDE